LVVAARRLVE
jgi:hypothetical protein